MKYFVYFWQDQKAGMCTGNTPGDVDSHIRAILESYPGAKITVIHGRVLRKVGYECSPGSDDDTTGTSSPSTSTKPD